MISKSARRAQTPWMASGMNQEGIALAEEYVTMNLAFVDVLMASSALIVVNPFTFFNFKRLGSKKSCNIHL